MFRRTILKSALAAAVAAVLPSLAHAAEPAAKPNVIVILADDRGYGDLGVQGGADIPTPTIDSRGGATTTMWCHRGGAPTQQAAPRRRNRRTASRRRAGTMSARRADPLRSTTRRVVHPKGARVLRPHTVSLVVNDGGTSISSTLLVCASQAPRARNVRLHGQAPR